MSTTVRDIRDAEEEEEERKQRLQEAEGEPDDEDESEDEDFKPDENDIDEEDGDEGEFEEGMECEIAGKAKAAPGSKRKLAAVAPTKAAPKPRKAGARGGIALSDEEDGATSAPTAPAQDPALPPMDPHQAEEDAKKAAADAKKAAADALWADLNGSSASKKPTPKLEVAGGLDIKSLLAQAGTGSSSSESAKMVTITETMSFAGKDVSVTKKVLAGSKEALAYQGQAKEAEAKKAAAASSGGLSAALAAAMSTGNELQRQMTGAKAVPSVSTSSELAFTGKLSASMRAPVQQPGVGATSLAGLLASIDGKKKMTAMEKSRHDWAGFKDKQDEHTRDEMSKFAKDGYLAKQAFLARTDDRQAQVARSNRRKGMGLKD